MNATLIALFSANVHLEDQFKWTALHHAANSGQLNVVRALADAGAKIEHESVTSATPLSRAIESSAADVVEYFIGKRANVRHENLTRKGFEYSKYGCSSNFSSPDSIVERNLLDLASDFASPEVFNIVRAAYEQKTTKKGSQQPKKRRPPPPAITKKKKPTDGVNFYTECQCRRCLL